jgi:hypothetical protein
MMFSFDSLALLVHDPCGELAVKEDEAFLLQVNLQDVCDIRLVRNNSYLGGRRSRGINAIITTNAQPTTADECDITADHPLLNRLLRCIVSWH